MEKDKIPKIAIGKSKPHLECRGEERKPSMFLKTPDELEFSNEQEPSFSQRSSDSDSIHDAKGKDLSRRSQSTSHPTSPNFEDEWKWTDFRKASSGKSENQGKDPEKKQPALEKMLRVLRRPSIVTMEIFSSFGKSSSNSRRESLANASNR